MELELALSLSSSSSSSSSSCFSQFDLNNYVSHGNAEAKDVYERLSMEPLKKRKPCINGDVDNGFHVPQTLPLLFCNKSNQEHDVDDGDGYDDHANDLESTFIFVNDNGEENGVIGWPPVKSSRKKLCHRGGDGNGGESKSMYVKVQMEGDGIARKINLNLHRSYHSLVHTLAHMFGKCYEDVKLTYQDKEGDWLLAGDVPWGSFTESVKRLKLLKSTC